MEKARMKSAWVRVSRKSPCPICEKTDWCGVSEDGAVVHCQRVESDKPAKGDMGGWIHRLKDAPKDRRPYVKPIKPTAPPSFDAERVMANLRAKTTPEQLATHAAALGVSAESLDALGAAWSPANQAWAFPMRNADGRATGIRLRNEAGEKWAVKGSKVGLFYDVALLAPGKDRTLYVCEGPTDTAAALTLGLQAVGRHACLGQASDIKALMKARGFNRVVAIADNDEAKRRPDGSLFYPGQEGARRLLDELKAAAKLVVPPAKDLRAWLREGATRQVLACIEAQQVWRVA